jgi:hypothetical protein
MNEAPVQSIVLSSLGPISDIEFGVDGIVAALAVGMQIRWYCFVCPDLSAFNQAAAVCPWHTREMPMSRPSLSD